MASRSETGSANYISTLEFPATVTVNVSRSHAVSVHPFFIINLNKDLRANITDVSFLFFNKYFLIWTTSTAGASDDDDSG